MTTINNISSVIYIIDTEENEQNIEKNEQPLVSPIQPPPGSSVSLNQLWRILSEAAKVLSDTLSGNAQENMSAKKLLIETLKDSRIAQLNERMQQLEKQEAAEKKKSIWGKIGMALSFVAAIVMAPFNPVMAAVMIGTIVATIIVPKIVDKILEASGVGENIRNWVKMSLEIVIAVVGTVVSFNPGNILSSASTMVTNAATKAVASVQKMMDTLKSIKAFSSIANKAQSIASKAMKLLEPLLTKIQEFAKGGKLAAARVGQVTSVSSDVTSVVSSGYSIKSASIMKDLDISQAEQEELEARFQQLQAFLNTVLRILSNAFESIFSIKNAERDFNQKMLAINL